MGLVGTVVESFSLGVATPLTAVCVIPLYPGFLAYLAGSDEGHSVVSLSVLVSLGVVGFMGGLGLVFSTALQSSLTRVVDVVSPVAFAILAVFSLVLLSGRSPGDRLPSIEPPRSRRPALSALAYGGFFGAVVLPCNPGFIAIFFARAPLFGDPVSSFANFLAFGFGIAAPLLGLAVVAEPYRDRVLGALTRHAGAVHRATGAVIFVVSLYYLLVVFDVFGLPP